MEEIFLLKWFHEYDSHTTDLPVYHLVVLQCFSLYDINPRLPCKVKSWAACSCCTHCWTVLYVPPSQSFSGLALAIWDQEYHGFLFADVSHDCGQLVDVATVEMLRLPQVQNHRGRACFGRKETHVSVQRSEKKNLVRDEIDPPSTNLISPS